jgi:hypothetical protein
MSDNNSAPSHVKPIDLQPPLILNTDVDGYSEIVVTVLFTNPPEVISGWVTLDTTIDGENVDLKSLKVKSDMMSSNVFWFRTVPNMTYQIDCMASFLETETGPEESGSPTLSSFTWTP